MAKQATEPFTKEDIQIGKQAFKKDAQHVFRKLKIKTMRSSTTHLLEWKKSQMLARVQSNKSHSLPVGCKTLQLLSKTIWQFLTN